MAKRFFTADWHLCDLKMLTIINREFSDVVDMNETLINNANAVATKNDIIIHAGDFVIYGGDGGFPKLKINPSKFVEKIDATFVNLEGNHDPTNKTKSIGWIMQTRLGNFPDVSIAHYPSYHEKIKDIIKPGWIHLCGHVHNKWKYYLDRERQVLNINVGVDVWDYRPVSEADLINYIKKIMVMILKR